MRCRARCKSLKWLWTEGTVRLIANARDFVALRKRARTRHSRYCQLLLMEIFSGGVVLSDSIDK
jgi:hypothetical protein